MSCPSSILRPLASALGVADSQLNIKTSKLRAIVGTKLANDSNFNVAFAADTLLTVQLNNVALDVAVEAYEQRAYDAMRAAADTDNDVFDVEHKKQAGKSIKSAKTWLRELLSAPDSSYTLKELVALTGKTEVNIRTMLSDLRSVKYAGSAGVFVTKSTRINNVTRYSKA